MNTELFPLVFAALYTGHSVGDHWIQTGYQSAHKHLRNRTGRWNCLKHVVTLTLTKLVLLSPVLALTHWPAPWWLCAGILLDASTHYWADRRYTLEGLAKRLNRIGLYHLGMDTVHSSSPEGSHVGTGKYVLDQAFHHLFLFVSAVLICL